MRTGTKVKRHGSALCGKMKYCFLLWGCVVLISGCSSFSPSGKSVRQFDEQSREKAAQARLTLGLAYLEQGNLKLAYSNLQRAVSYSSDNYQTHLAMALYEQQVGEYDKALKSYQSALKLAPHDGTVLNRYGAFLCRSGKYDLAHQQFDLARNATNYDTIAGSLENAGYCYLKQGQYERAREFLSRALKYDPAKGKNLLVVTKHYMDSRQHEHVAILLDIYQQNSPETAESVWLQIRFAILNESPDNVRHYGQRLAKHFSQSEQYKQFLAHEN